MRSNRARPAYAGESGYYKIDGNGQTYDDGVNPTLTVKIGETLVFDQSHDSNWYHPIGFAYEPDGAHGKTWGGDELPEVEGYGELRYFIDGSFPTCADAGDTGLDCYEPEFFFPRGEWAAKKYKAAITVTQAVADASNGGEIYYFCHIHSKMSGKIVIKNADGSAYTNSKSTKSLYDPVSRATFDKTCGTTGIADFAPGASLACSENFISGSVDTDFEKCLQAADCAMNRHMRVLGHDTHKTAIATFAQQMIPHHLNAVNMAKILMKQVTAADITAAMDEDGLTDILWSIINVQNFQVHQFRNYLNALSPSLLLEDDIADNMGGLSTGAIVGIAIGAAVGGIVLAGGTIFLAMKLAKGGSVAANTAGKSTA